MAELLVQAKKHWVDNLAPEQIAKMKDPVRVAIGDVVVVRPDGWQWGREEKLPHYIVIKLPGVPVSDVAYLEQPEYDDTKTDKEGKVKRLRKFKIDDKFVTDSIADNPSVSVFQPSNIKDFKDKKIKDKSK